MNTTTQNIDAAINTLRASAGNDGTTCCTCGRAASAPYRRSVNGRIVEGCVDASHSGLLTGADAEWHNRPQARTIRANELAAIS